MPWASTSSTRCSSAFEDAKTSSSSRSCCGVGCAVVRRSCHGPPSPRPSPYSSRSSRCTSSYGGGHPGPQLYMVWLSFGSALASRSRRGSSARVRGGGGVPPPPAEKAGVGGGGGGRAPPRGDGGG